MAGPIVKGPAPWYSQGVKGKKPILPSTSATVTLKKSQSGQRFALDRAAAISYALPAPPVAGLTYDFLVTVLQTAGAYVITAGAGVFLLGSIIAFSGEDVTPSATLGPKMFAGNGTTHIKLTTNGTTLGGGIGSWFRFTALSATQWYVEGVVKSPSGSIATPFST